MAIKYSLVEVHEDTWAVRLDESEYVGVVYRYGEVKFIGEDTEGNGILNFEYEVIEDMGISPKELTSKEFESILGDILTNLIQEAVELKDEKNREGNSI